METLNLIDAVHETAGDRNHRNGYSTDKLANFFRKNHDFARFVANKNEDDEIQIDELFERVSDCLDFNVYLQRKVATHLKGVFTSDQLACIFQAYNGIWIQYFNLSEGYIKGELYDYISHEGQAIYGLDIEEFKGRIEAINDFEFEVFVNLIQEAWGITEENIIGKLHDYLKSDN